MILKRKSRYILIKASKDIDMSLPVNWYDFKRRIGVFLGIMGLAKANPNFVRTIGDSFIVRVNRGSEDMFIAATSFVKEVNGKKVGFYTLLTSGTIAAIQRRHLNQQQ